MAISEDSVASRAKLLLSSRGEDTSGLHLYRLIALIPNARRRMADGRDAFRKDFALTVTNGAVDLSGASFLGAAEPLILKMVRLADIRSASSDYKWQWVGNRSVLSLQSDPTDFFHFTLEGSTLYTDSTDSTATMRAAYEPSLSTIETQGLDDELVELLASMVLQGAQNAVA